MIGTKAGPFSAAPIIPTGDELGSFLGGFDCTSISLSKNPGDLNTCSLIFSPISFYKAI
jgi:hypothetical protein